MHESVHYLDAGGAAQSKDFVFIVDKYTHLPEAISGGTTGEESGFLVGVTQISSATTLLTSLHENKAELAEKQLAGKTKEAKEAKESAEAAKSKADKLAKENKEKDAKIKDLEKLLAEALAKVSTLEKRLNDVSLNLKATGESSDGALL